jgi:hypothetical protein
MFLCRRSRWCVWSWDGGKPGIKIKVRFDCIFRNFIWSVSGGPAFLFVSSLRWFSCLLPERRLMCKKARHYYIRQKYVRAARAISGT